MIVAAAVEAVVGVGVAVLRRRLLGRRLDRPLLVVIGATAAVIVIGTVVDVSGVALGLPVAAAMVVVVGRSRWRSGDAAILALASAAAVAVAYRVAATLDPDTGSYGDQGAWYLGVVAAMVTAVALVNGWWRLRRRV